ncbi:MAG TPA: type II toxin-antitoxin system VapC family toxin [Gemmataceae bacterium]|nr:type II toxin-antitoxin system VapC family toxin [Gemmataceae bacterium]
MTFDDFVAGDTVFLDANVLAYHASNHRVFGPACSRLLARVQNQELTGYTSAHVLGEMAHRLMAIEAADLFGWPPQGMANRLRRHPGEVQQLGRYRTAIDELDQIGVIVLDVTRRLVSKAADVTGQFGLLANDALIVAVMQDAGLTHLASNDADFDRVPGITRYAPD